MTNKEAYQQLKSRVEWQKPLDEAFSFLDFQEPLSGRYLQEEHSAVRIPIIYETIVDVDISNENIQLKLEYIKEKGILQMLHDVFYDQKEICDYWIENNLQLFDYAIILKTSINVISGVLGSNRLNNTKIVTEENLKRWFIDLNGIKDRENGVFVSGFVERYNREVNKIRKSLFIKNRTLKVVTAR